ncbi:hybrid sensor histidine kinase/response regulator [Actinoplanes teichomyceticus]|uniref:histidine kinase n=1 Tax=Actinoplanes teichomyceticus TaxID=1867 RepID=A0A561VIZ5_ACTTI|nr:PAS domain-containing sensor histidine kinase [Actinoplanes teichomyceticus]TWG11569.1 PAS domain S-box-containing protein [Actinoplanes teichomyceticus]GIF16014.1 hypothetical protein Ate01nite_60460 [Actinoplanes teichomyceticus]
MSYVTVAVASVTVLAAVAAALPADALGFGMVAVAPALAAPAASPAAVLAVGGYALAAGFAVSSWQGLLGTGAQIDRMLLTICSTVVCWLLARHHRRALRVATDAATAREMFAAVAEQSTDAIITCTLDGTVTAWNGGAERIYGWSAGEAVGQRCADLLPPESVGVLEDVLARLAHGEQVHLEQADRVRADGTPFLVSVTVWPIRDENGVVVAAAATERDVTEERRAQERSARAARLESLGQLAGGIAHDFNNLLAIILNHADFLAEEVSGQAAEDVTRIRGAADRAKALTGQLLVFAKREPTRVEILDLNRVVAEAGELLERTIGENIRLVCHPGPGCMPVRANRGRLDQILLNLVINARDAMPDGGVVVVETDWLNLDERSSSGLPPGRYVRLTVSDTGTGMTAEVRDRLFEPFFTTKPPDRGTGLGLATVYGIVDEAGGTIGVESAPGCGTTFRILLPSAATAETAGHDPAAGPAPGHGELILVVEDDEFVRDLVVRILRDNGYRAAALEDPLLDDDLSDVSLIIFDVVLRGRSGPALAEQVRSRRPDLRVLFMSGYSDVEVRREYHLGPDARIVQKPFTAAELLAGVGEVLGSRQVEA